MKHEDYEETDVIVHNSGWCFWIPPMTTYTYCGMDFTYWPWDIQNCVVTYGSWTKSGWEMDIHNRNGKNVPMQNIFLNEISINGNFNISEVRYNDTYTPFQCLLDI